VRLVRERPVLGWGPEGFRTGFPRVVSRQWVTRYGQEQVQDRAHNELLDTASATGLLGLASYVALLAALAFTARDARRAGGMEVAGIVAGLLGYLAHAQFLFDTFDLAVVFWVLAGALAVEAGALRSWRTPRPALLTTTSALAGTAVVWGSLGVLADRRVSAAVPGPPAAVVSSLAHAAALRPRTLEYYLLAARVATDSGAERALRRAHALLQSWPDRDVRLSDAGVLTTLGAVTGEPAFVEEAASTYDSIVRREPFAGLAWLGLGEARLRLGQGAEARDALVHAASLLPRSAEPHLALGFLEVAAGDSANAKVHLDAARRIAPRDPRVADLARELAGK
jgi:tetratricopeptide (TPR) repeat protein